MLEDIHRIVTDREWYDKTLYTPLTEAYEELERRRRDAVLERNVLELLNGIVPEPLREKPRAVFCRSLMSPNFEIRLFTDVIERFGKIEPLYWEYCDDKFASVNESKRMLGKLYFLHGRGRKNGIKNDLLNIIDFTSSDGKKISAMRTLWGQSFVDFHHELFDAQHRVLSHTFYDSSRWLGAHGESAKSYYPAFLALFIRHGILFENVLLNEQEISFTKNVFLPTFLTLHRELGVKPLIVPLEPIHTERNRLWMYYPGEDQQYVAEKLQRVA
jgi:hypothetical protein